MNNDIIVIADTQVYKGVPLDHLKALGKYIWDIKPKHIIHIGDNYDFPSLCSYNTQKAQEGKRFIDDFRAGTKALKIITTYIEKRNRIRKQKKYRPVYNFIKGNHEHRLETLIENNPYLEGLVNLDQEIKDAGWIVNKYLYPLWIDTIAFNHYMPNPLSGKPIGGSIENKLNKHPHSFVHGHVQQYQFGRRQTLDGKPHFGVCAGSFYMHDEEYRGSCNTEIRGFVHMKHFKNRYKFSDYDIDFVSLERLMEMY